MKIKINNEDIIDIADDEDLTIVNKRLYNKKTKSYEGIDGDIVSFISNNRIYKGTVDGYTHGSVVKFRGVDTIYTDAKDKKVDHVSVITSCDEEPNQNDLLNIMSEEIS